MPRPSPADPTVNVRAGPGNPRRRRTRLGGHDTTAVPVARRRARRAARGRRHRRGADVPRPRRRDRVVARPARDVHRLHGGRRDRPVDAPRRERGPGRRRAVRRRLRGLASRAPARRGHRARRAGGRRRPGPGAPRRGAARPRPSDHRAARRRRARAPRAQRPCARARRPRPRPPRLPRDRDGVSGMAANLRRMVVLGPSGTINPGTSHDYRQADNRRFFAETGTRWVRMWADWPTLMPTANGFAQPIIDSLDEQIAFARRDGLRIVLTLYRFPRWANGTDQIDPAAPQPDRMARGGTSVKTLEFRYPSDVGVNSDWGRFVDSIASRYSAGNPARPSLDATIDVLEIANEPNLQWWPQQGPSPTADPFDPGPLVVHEVLVRMFATAKAIVARYGDEPMLGGPAMADSVGDTRLRTGYGTLSDALLPALRTAGFTAGERFVWTHHNYTDVTFDQGAGTTAPPDAANTDRTKSFAADMRQRLIAGGWAGWPAADPADPWIMLTEGGVTNQSIRTRWGIPDSNQAAQRAKQADLIQRAWDRMASTADGAGIAVMSNYLWYTDPNFDSGLADTFASGGAIRPAYTTWRGLPSFA